MVDALVPVAGDDALVDVAGIERSATSARNHVGDAITRGAIVVMVMPVEDSRDAILDKKGTQNFAHILVGPMRAYGIGRDMEEDEGRFPLVARCLQILDKPFVLGALRTIVGDLIYCQRDKVGVILIEGVVEFVAGSKRRGDMLLIAF